MRRAWCTRARRRDGPDQGALCAGRRRARTLGDIIEGADVFLGLSAGGVLKPDMVKRMARDPLILALANPTPEILPERPRRCAPMPSSRPAARTTRTRSTMSCAFPFLFRGALDVGATTINEEMKSAAVRAIAELAHAEMSDVVATAYGDQRSPVRPRLPDPDPVRSAPDRAHRPGRGQGRDGQRRGDAARWPTSRPTGKRMARFMYQSGASMEPVFAAAKVAQKRVAFAGRRGRSRAAGGAADRRRRPRKPVLVGRPDIINPAHESLGLRLEAGRNCEIVCSKRSPL